MKKLLTLAIILMVTTIAVSAQTPPIHTHNYTTRDGLGSNVVNCGLQDHQGYLWFC